VFSFLRAFLPEPCTLFSPLPIMPHAPPTHLTLLRLHLPNDI
jgi:hypothetical protein